MSVKGIMRYRGNVLDRIAYFFLPKKKKQKKRKDR